MDDDINRIGLGIEFVRQLEVESANVDLQLIQYSEGDVSCVVWDAGIVLGKYLDKLNKGRDIFLSKKVIDIGSGTGVAGLFASAMGADTTLTDLPDVIPLLKKNIEKNRDVLKGSASAAVLVWGELKETFPDSDYILVSDCIYYDVSVEKLVPTLHELCGPKTEVFISYEDRVHENAKQLLTKFLDVLKQKFHVELIPQSSHHQDFSSSDIYILKCLKK